jgi:hypothetical protein
MISITADLCNVKLRVLCLVLMESLVGLLSSVIRLCIGLPKSTPMVKRMKKDVYSIGNIFYTLLADRQPWDGIEEIAVQEHIMSGTRSYLPESKAQSQDAIDATLQELLYQCFEQEPKNRPRARKVL